MTDHLAVVFRNDRQMVSKRDIFDLAIIRITFYPVPAGGDQNGKCGRKQFGRRRSGCRAGHAA